jgi:hypothetical protein
MRLEREQRETDMRIEEDRQERLRRIERVKSSFRNCHISWVRHIRRFVRARLTSGSIISRLARAPGATETSEMA